MRTLGAPSGGRSGSIGGNVGRILRVGPVRDHGTSREPHLIGASLSKGLPTVSEPPERGHHL